MFKMNANSALCHHINSKVKFCFRCQTKKTVKQAETINSYFQTMETILKKKTRMKNKIDNQA